MASAISEPKNATSSAPTLARTSTRPALPASRAGGGPGAEPGGEGDQRGLRAERRPGDQARGADEQDRPQGGQGRRRELVVRGAERVHVRRPPARLAQPAQQRRQRDAQDERQRDDPPAHVVAVGDVVPEPVGAVVDDPLEAEEDEPVDHADGERDEGQRDDGARPHAGIIPDRG